ncbi:MAG: hypothetical protein AAF613_01925 [Pseudomonadota bacterium]
MVVIICLFEFAAPFENSAKWVLGHAQGTAVAQGFNIEDPHPSSDAGLWHFSLILAYQLRLGSTTQAAAFGGLFLCEAAIEVSFSTILH